MIFHGYGSLEGNPWPLEYFVISQRNWSDLFLVIDSAVSRCRVCPECPAIIVCKTMYNGYPNIDYVSQLIVIGEKWVPKFNGSHGRRWPIWNNRIFYPSGEEFSATRIWLVVWNMFYFSIQLGLSSSQLTVIFFRGVGIPPTSIVIPVIPLLSHYYYPY